MSDVDLARMLGELAAGLERPQDPIEDRVKKAREAAARKDILAWGKAVMPEKFHLPYSDDLHGYFVKIRHAEFTDTEAPRDHAKTAIRCNLIQLFQALEEPDLFDYYLNVQSTEKKALAVNFAIKLEIEQNEVIREIYGDQVGTDKWTDQVFVLKNGVVFHGVGSGQSIRGTQYRNRRPNYAVVDDLYDEEDINKPEITLKKNEWFWGTLFPIMAEDRKSSLHVQGTAINDVDLLKELSTKPGVLYKSFRSIISDAAKKVLWPALKSYAQRAAQRAIMPAIIFEREYQNKRTDSANAIVQRSWLDNWEYEPAHVRFGPDLRLITTRLSIDPSIGKNSENDPAAYILGHKVMRPNGTLPEYYIESAKNKLMSLQERLDTARDFWRDRPPDRPLRQVRVETISGFSDFGTMVSKTLPVPTEMVDKVPDKLTHLQKKSHCFQSKRVFINRNIDPEIKKEIVNQLTTNHPHHDDLRDAILHLIDDETAMWKMESIMASPMEASQL